MKTTLLRIMFIAAIMMAIIPAVSAFESTLTLQGGVSIPSTDVSAEKTLHPMFGLSYEGWLKRYLSLGISPYYTQLEGVDNLNTYKSTIIGGDVFLKLRATKFLALNFSDEAVINRIAPFVAAGVGVARYASTGSTDDGVAANNDTFDTNKVVLVAPHLAAGVSLLTKWNFNIDLGVKAEYTATDMIDNVEKDSNDMFIAPYLGIGFNFGRPKAKLVPTVQTTGTFREFTAVKGSPSVAQSYTVSGTDLKKNINVTAPNGYELSIDGGRSYVKTANLDPTFEGPILVRMTGAQAGTYNGNIVTSSEGAQNVNLAVNGTVTEYPVPTPVLMTGGTLTNFIADKGTASVPQSFSISGTDLKENIEITAPNGYEISIDGGKTYSKTARLDPNFNGTVLVRLTAVQAGTYNGNIVISSTGAKNITLPVTGTVKELPQAGDVLLRIVHFDTNYYVLSASDKALLDEVAASLKQNPSVKIQVQGHTDNTGNETINKPLGVNRAKVVKDYLVSKGIDPSRLEVKGFSDTKPVDTNDTIEGRSKNRRTDLIIIK